MPFEMDDPQCLHRRFCSVEIFVPSQLENPDDTFALYASAWFGTIKEDIETANGLQSITIGAHSAILAIETCEYSSIEKSEGTRYKSDPLTLAYERRDEEGSTRKREGSLGGGLSVPLRNILKIRGEGDLSSVRNVSKAESLQQGSTFNVFEVETASPWEWRLQAVNPARPVPRLSGAELSDVPLCRISTPKDTAFVTAKMSISALDLWLDINTTAAAGSALEDEANQNAVLAALMGKAVEVNSVALSSSDVDDGECVIASSTLHRRNAEEDT